MNIDTGAQRASCQGAMDVFNSDFQIFSIGVSYEDLQSTTSEVEVKA